MTRGIWRWWRGEAGAEIWWARVERHPGEFVDVEASQYEAEQYQPPFWKLPLKEEHMEGLAGDFLRGNEAIRRGVTWAGWAIVLLTALLLLWTITRVRWI